MIISSQPRKAPPLCQVLVRISSTFLINWDLVKLLETVNRDLGPQVSLCINVNLTLMKPTHNKAKDNIFVDYLLSKAGTFCFAAWRNLLSSVAATRFSGHTDDKHWVDSSRQIVLFVCFL